MFGKNNNTKFAKKNRDTILPPKTALLLNDLVAVMIFALGFILALMLFTYHPNDNCWFKTTDAVITYNKLGAFGAYFADFILSIFGFSGWWLVLGLFYIGYCKIIRNKILGGDWYTIFQVISFIFLIISSSVFEYINFFHTQSLYLHNGFGGLLGLYAYPVLSDYLGQLGTALITIVFVVVCFSFSFSVSLGYIAEKVGSFLDFIYATLHNFLGEKSLSNDSLNSKSQNIKTKNIIPTDNVIDTPSYNEKDNDGFAALFAKPDGSTYIRGNTTNASENNISKAKTNILKRMYQTVAPISINTEEDTPDTMELPDYIDLDNSESLKISNDINNLEDDDPAHPHASDNFIAHLKNKIHHPISNSTFGELPSTDLLNIPKKQMESISKETLEYVSNSIENKLAEFGVEAKIVEAQSGPVVTRYELLPSRGVRGEKIVGLGKEIARGLALSNVRIVETIPGKNTMGIEVPNFKRQVIYLKEIFDSIIYKNSTSKLTLALGKDIAGNVIVTDLAKMPHLLVAGTTGSGKSVAVNAMILSILFQATVNEVRFIMIDPKMVELSFYQGIPHLLAPVITDPNQAINALKWTVGEMERRYKIMAKVGSKNIVSFNQKIEEANYKDEPIGNPLSLTPDDPENLEKWAFIVVIIDELADLMMSSGKKVEQYIVRIAQKARAVGIHLIVATQRPSVDVITGLIKANIPSRISFQVTSKVDSRTILDQGGAETLLGQGDMLYLQPGSGYPQRIHGAFVNDDELNKVVDFLKTTSESDYIDEILTGEIDGVELPGFDDSSDNNVEKDTMFDEAVKFIYDTKRCSISSLQTRFGIGYNRAARIMSHLETIGMVRRNERGGFELLKIE
ncbi:MAG: DNA translocase FtsK 4TM domain-containing protein [Proteobacteria bacterium]|nr:DNA translocase FtsK 4TM domain-containing protein [Pseudomonadota bacterium]